MIYTAARGSDLSLRDLTGILGIRGRCTDGYATYVHLVGALGVQRLPMAVKHSLKRWTIGARLIQHLAYRYYESAFGGEQTAKCCSRQFSSTSFSRSGVNL